MDPIAQDSIDFHFIVTEGEAALRSALDGYMQIS